MAHNRLRLVFAASLALLAVMPIMMVVWLALFPTENIWPHLSQTVLPRYLKTTILLMLCVGLGSLIIGTLLAFWATHYRFAGRGWLQYAVLLPLSIPPYVGAFAMVDFFEFAGPVQTALRDLFGWQTARDYWFPDIRTFGGAALVLTATLFPYVYLLARASFKRQSANALDVSKSMGLSDFSHFWRIALPMARPGIIAGLAIVLMETVNDFGTVDYFAVQTLTTGIFSIWLEGHNAGGAAQIALCVLAMVLLLFMVERIARQGAKFYNQSRQMRPIAPRQIAPWAARSITAAFALVFATAFVLPVAVLLYHSQLLQYGALLAPLKNSFILGLITAGICVSFAFYTGFGLKTRLGHLLTQISSLGYAVPGAVLGLGVLIMLSSFDHWFTEIIEAIFNYDIGLLLTGGMGALVFAYTVRFCAIGYGATHAGLAGISPNIPLAAQSLGAGGAKLIYRIIAPLMQVHLASAALLIFVDSVKELPATLLLRPFNFETLATHSYAYASLEDLSQAAPSALIIVLISTCAVVLLAKANP